MTPVTPYDRVRARAEEMGLRPADKSGGFGCDCPLQHKSREMHVWVYRTKGGGYKPMCKGGQGHDEDQLVEAFGVPAIVEKPSAAGCTLEEYAEAKRLPVDFLSKLGLKTVTYRGEASVFIPHYDVHGTLAGSFFRTRVSPRATKWKKGDKAIAYGLERVRDAYAAKRITVVEGQSDAQTLWLHDEPALGLPGAGGWNRSVEAALSDVESIAVVIEPGKAGDDLRDTLGRSPLRDRIRLVRLGKAKDPSGLYLEDPENFRARWKSALDQAPRLVDELDTERARRLAIAREHCASLLEKDDLLGAFSEESRKLVAGEARTAKIVFLSQISRRFARPASIIVKGNSSSGKSYTVETTLRFFPDSTRYVLTAMSDRAIIFEEAEFTHRFIVVFEAEGVKSDMGQYILRSLLSEGRVQYAVTEKDEHGKMATRHITKEGPTGLLMTTTRTRVHDENETRLLSVTTDDTNRQTEAVLAHIAESDTNPPDIDFAPWHALSDVIEEVDPRVVVPYVRALASKIPGVAVRLRRDFTMVLVFIKAHALLHQHRRKRDSRGRLVATLEDYKVVRGLLADLVSEGVDASVSKTVRETIAAVAELEGDDGTSVTKVAEKLRLDKGTASRRLRQATEKGFVVNLTDPDKEKGKPARYKIGTPIPEDTNVLPFAEDLGEDSTTETEPDIAEVAEHLTADDVNMAFGDPDEICPTCGPTTWYVYGSAPPTCSKCHPPAAPDRVHWIGREEVAGDAR